MIQGFETLIEDIDKKLLDQGFGEGEFELDHVGYKCSSLEDYMARRSEYGADAEMVHENNVGGRMVAVFKFPAPLVLGNHKVLGFELVAPKEGEECQSYWEHVEYVVKGSLQELVDKHPGINWDVAALNRPEFSKVAIRYPDGTSAKFHTETVLQEVARMHQS